MLDDFQAWIVRTICSINSIYRVLTLSPERAQYLDDKRMGILCSKHRFTVIGRKRLRKICWELGITEFEFRMLYCTPSSYRQFRRIIKAMKSIDQRSVIKRNCPEGPSRPFPEGGRSDNRFSLVRER